MTHDTGLVAGRHADTEVFYMAGKQLGALGRRLLSAGWPADVPVVVVSRAGWADQLASDHTLATLGRAALLHAGRPTVVTVGVGARALARAAVDPAAAPAEQGLPANTAEAAAGTARP
jgi:uroporphyrin-III C-methyltransferase